MSTTDDSIGMHDFINEWDNIMEQLRALEKESKEFEKLKTKFSISFALDVIELTLDWFPELIGNKKTLSKDLKILGELILDDVSDLTFFYIEGNQGYRFGLYLPDFSIGSFTDAENAEILKICRKQEVWEEMNESFRTDYAESVYFKAYQWHLFNLIKRMMPEYDKDIINLSSQGFRELEGLLYIKMLDTFEVIRETQNGEIYFKDIPV